MSYGTTELPYTAARIKGIIKATGQVTVKPAGLAGIQLDCNGATGDFTASITPANLTGNRRWTLPNRDDTFAGLGAQTFLGAQIFNAAITMPNGSTAAALAASGTDVNEVRGITVANNSGASYYALSAMGNTGYGITNWPNSLVIEAVPTGSGNLVLGAYSNKIVLQTSARTVQALVISANGDSKFNSSTASTNTTTGALVVTGGVGIGGALNVGGALEVSGATLIKSNTTLTDGAAAAAGTLTNAPTAGNPTKWVLINDNGVIRKFPTWT